MVDVDQESNEPGGVKDDASPLLFLSQHKWVLDEESGQRMMTLSFVPQIFLKKQQESRGMKRGMKRWIKRGMKRRESWAEEGTGMRGIKKLKQNEMRVRERDVSTATSEVIDGE